MRRSLILAVLGSCLLAACEQAPPRVDGIVRAVRPAMFDCPDRVWAGSSEAFRTRAQTAFVSLSEPRAYLFNDLTDGPADEPRLTVLDPALLPATLRTGIFGYAEFRGVPTMGISLDETAEWLELLRSFGVERPRDPADGLTLHEGFHFLSGQRGWQDLHSGARGAPYPSQTAPRYMRAALERALVAAVRGEADLGPAAFWLERYRTEEPEDAARLRSLDRLEGSAQYYELMGTALADVGCGASEEALEAAALALVAEVVGVDDLRAITEPYDLGALSGLLLRRRVAPGWEREVETGATMIELALDGVSPVPVADDPALLRAVQNVGERENANRAAHIEPLLMALDDPDHVRLVLPGEWGLGSFSTSDFVWLVEVEGQPQALLNVWMELAQPSTGAAIRVDQATLLLVQDPTRVPCSGVTDGAFVAIVPRASVSRVGPQSQIDSPTLRTDPLSVTEVTAEGVPWLCPIALPSTGLRPSERRELPEVIRRELDRHGHAGRVPRTP